MLPYYLLTSPATCYLLPAHVAVTASATATARCALPGDWARGWDALKGAWAACVAMHEYA